MKTFAAFAAGLVFAFGLVVSGMTNPQKVVAFLDVTGSWDPSLALVMVGAIVVHTLGLRLAKGRARPRFAPSFELPAASGTDTRLVLGAALFGIGWGLSGYCPGPSVVSLASRSIPALAFFCAMATGLALTRVFTEKKSE